MPLRVDLPPLNTIPSLLWQDVETPRASAGERLPEDPNSVFSDV
jgi:hypothetical protein